MKKIRKGKKILLIILMTIIVALAIFFIVKLVNKIQNEPGTQEEVPQVFSLPETVYSNMQVKNIVMELLKGNAQDGSDQTMVSFDIHNTTETPVQEQYFDAVLIGPDDSIIATMEHTYIQQLDVGQVHEVSLIYKGDLTATTKIKLIEKEN